MQIYSIYGKLVTANMGFMKEFVHSMLDVKWVCYQDTGFIMRLANILISMLLSSIGVLMLRWIRFLN